MVNKRASGILLHVSSLPSKYGVGDLVPMQDVLGMDEHARMNRPGTVMGNWSWRLEPGKATASAASKLAKLAQLYGRI